MGHFSVRMSCICPACNEKKSCVQTALLEEKYIVNVMPLFKNIVLR